MNLLGASFSWTSRRRRPPSAASPGSVAERARATVEPALAALVGEIVAVLRDQERHPVPVTDPSGRHWAPAYVLGSIRHTVWASSTGTGSADVVLDGSGRLVLNHPVQVAGTAARPLPVSCPSLSGGYDMLVGGDRNYR